MFQVDLLLQCITIVFVLIFSDLKLNVDITVAMPCNGNINFLAIALFIYWVPVCEILQFCC